MNIYCNYKVSFADLILTEQYRDYMEQDPLERLNAMVGIGPAEETQMSNIAVACPLAQPGSSSASSTQLPGSSEFTFYTSNH